MFQSTDDESHSCKPDGMGRVGRIGRVGHDDTGLRGKFAP